MKVIFSRKGWDSGYGGRPSPVFADKTLQSLPIEGSVGSPLADTIQPTRLKAKGFSDLAAFFDDYHPSTARLPFVHLDPDLDSAAVSRDRGWRPSFGQASSAASHLDKKGVGEGDLFLFYGWFDDVCRYSGRWRREGRDRFVVWGWLQVGEIHRPGSSLPIPAWLSNHPHVLHDGQPGYRKNRIYSAAAELCLGGDVVRGWTGGGIFSHEHPIRMLTNVPGRRGLRPDRLPDWLEATKFRQEHVWDTALDPDAFTYLRSFFR